MVVSPMHTFHLNLNSKEINNIKLAILPGDPDRVKKIALLMDNPKYISKNREFTIWSANLNKNKIIICSTGIGGPSTSIVVEELSQLGIRIFLRIGTAGAIQPYLTVGSVLIVTAAVRYDGASQHFAPLEFPAVADLSCSLALIQSAQAISSKTYWGINVSSDTFYPGQERLNTYSGWVIKKLKGSMEEWKNMGVMGYEMESATLLTMCASQKNLRAGSIVGIIVNRTQKEIPNLDSVLHAENIAIQSVIKAAKMLLSNQNNIFLNKHNYNT
ncbi:uridine phosphorylase [Candidatus Blochmanniella floridana]|uniref:Uridine phosphorylase n=1 Tax=Blochmanniella floridana TaxID=203907 RepID=Q7VRI9_BLOFL|nr:uridine phosphorylase [Candidatus Blochmannia floridanus]